MLAEAPKGELDLTFAAGGPTNLAKMSGSLNRNLRTHRQDRNLSANVAMLSHPNASS